ncbi:LacI family DNA-binding transcriptional regulator [Demequina lignilytica]|uniref:LacI family DNA-binding transcriptional regulator n=1 Tax=Demequina lignilytica TaxID=3051663 RepID=A0AB35MGK6_9MICO|nr:LacI family DNA-binding transcriptional regulator [Demequina sp. SYSU T0a273]MDN4482901.1 LacI family DNA-binding transcriptional regulator [Demequina sp. SYSU T0a273]
MDTSPRVTLADVAHRAGVSVATVSKVVNGRYGVSRATVARVHGAIEELGYDAGLATVRARGPRTRAVAVLAPQFDAYVAELLKGVAAALADAGYGLHLHVGGPDHGWERKSLSTLAGVLADGAVIIGPTVVNASTRIPTVALDPHYRFTPRPTVAADADAGIRLATRHLIDLGHRRIGFLAGRHDLDSSRRAEEAFRETLEAAGIACDQDLMAEAEGLPERAAHAAEAMLAFEQPPTAVVSASDGMAIAFMETALDAGLAVPEDLSIIGYGGVPEACTAPVPLTTVRQPLHEMGVEVVRMLLERLAGREPAEPHVIMPVELEERASTAPPR